MNRNAYVMLHAAPTLLLLVAIAPLPYGYYTFMRIVVCAAAAWLAFMEYRRAGSVTPWLVALGLTAVLFNPLIPIQLTRTTWAWLDLAGVVVFAAHWFTGKTEK